MPGPIPNRSDDLARPRERKGRDIVPVTKGKARPVTIPDPDEAWHPIAAMLWEGLTTSGQADYYQDSDWAIAYALCDDLSHYKMQGRRSAQMAQVIYSTLSNLLVTEGDRRRARLELSPDEPEQDGPEVAVMDEYRRGLSAVK